MSGLFHFLWHVGLSSVAPHHCRRIRWSPGGRWGQEGVRGGHGRTLLPPKPLFHPWLPSSALERVP